MYICKESRYYCNRQFLQFLKSGGSCDLNLPKLPAMRSFSSNLSLCKAFCQHLKRLQFFIVDELHSLASSIRYRSRLP